MAEPYRISDAAVTSRRRSMMLVPVIAGAVVVFRVFHGHASIATSIVVAVVVLGLACFVAFRQFREFALYAANHSLTVTSDALEFTDGPSMQRIPFSAIDSVTIRKPAIGPSTIEIKGPELDLQRLSGYDRFRELAEQILRKVPNARVKGV